MASGAESPDGYLEVTTEPCHDTQIRAHFLGSKGAFATGMKVNAPTPTHLECPGLNGGEPDCLWYTGECASTVTAPFTPQFTCPADPNSYPNEISCACAPSAVNQAGLWNYALDGLIEQVGAGTSESIHTSLLIDDDVDGNSTNEFFDEWKKNPNGSDQARIYQLFDSMWRLDWEDLYTSGQKGDFNDYIATIELQSCGQTSNGDFIYPDHIRRTDYYVGCESSCGTGSCDSMGRPNYPIDIRLSAAVGLDDLTETGREAKGRQIHVTVNTFMQKSLNKRVAICPTLIFDWPNGAPPPTFESQGYVYQGSGFTDPACSSTMFGTATGEPVCSQRHTKPPTLEVAFAQEQLINQSCGPRTIRDDVQLNGITNCGASATVQQFEIALSDIDAVVNDLFNTLNDKSYTDLRSLLRQVRITVYENLGTKEFYCPSGVGVNFEAVPSDVAIAHSVLLNASSLPPNLNIYRRR